MTHFKFSSHVASISSAYEFANIDEKQESLNIEEYKFCHLKNRLDVDLYSCETGSFKLCDSRIEPQDNDFQFRNFAVCMFMNKLYMLGGRSVFNSSECTMYDPETKQLTRMERMQRTRTHHSCVVFAGKIVVTGGLRWFETRGSVEAYDHFENKWSYMPDLLERRFGHGSVAIGNKLYVIGGVDTESSEVFDYISNNFTLIKPLPLSYWSDHYDLVSFFRVKDKIIVKYDAEDKEVDNIFIYDTKENKWSSTSVKYFKENSCQVMYS